jgi:hypothetical protein
MDQEITSENIDSINLPSSNKKKSHNIYIQVLIFKKPGDVVFARNVLLMTLINVQ